MKKTLGLLMVLLVLVTPVASAREIERSDYKMLKLDYPTYEEVQKQLEEEELAKENPYDLKHYEHYQFGGSDYYEE